MPSVDIRFEVYSRGFTGKNYRNQVLIGKEGQANTKFSKSDFRAAIKFIMQCMLDWNQGLRGVQGRSKPSEKRDKEEPICESRGQKKI
jgi:hypothetical protein